MFRYFILISIIFLPNILLAAVTINEIAWMGSIDSTNDEWIELYNNGSSVSVDGWTLSDGVNLNISLMGVINSDSYAVLERTDDTSAPGSAFLIYTGALGNDGRTLTLRRADGSIEDQVVGGNDWQNIGGDKVTKETAQYTNNGWITGPATPGKKNINSGSTNNSVTKNHEDIVNQNDGVNTQNEYISLVEPDNELILSITAPKTGYVHQPVLFSVTAEGLGKRIMDSLSYEWNFGNLNTASGQEVQAVYTHPGTYVVVVEAKYTKYTALALHKITILPTTISLMKDKEGDILIQNNAHYEADVSGFVLASEEKIVFPPYTFLAPKATIVIPIEKITHKQNSVIVLYDRGREVVASIFNNIGSTVTTHESLEKSILESSPTENFKVKSVSSEDPVVPETLRYISATSTTKETDLSSNTNKETSKQTSANVATAITAGIPNEKLPYLGLISLITIGIIALYSSNQKK